MRVQKVLARIFSMIGLFFLGMITLFLELMILIYLTLGYNYGLKEMGFIEQVPSGKEVVQSSGSLTLYLFIFVFSVIFRSKFKLKGRLWVILKGSVIIFFLLEIFGLVVDFALLKFPLLVVGGGFLVQLFMSYYSAYFLPKKLFKKYAIKAHEMP